MFSLQRVRFVSVRILGVLLLLLAVNVGSAGASSAKVGTTCDPFGPFARGNFSNLTRIDNKWLPLVPGTQFILDGQSDLGGGLLPHRNVFTVTDLTKVLNGVRTVVIWDQDIHNGQLIEAELSFFAQDNSGNVWNLGEYPELYEGGVFVGAPSTWIGGLADAISGLQMLATPRVGTPSYVQGRALKIGFFDCGKVVLTGQTFTGSIKTYQHVLVTNEWNPLDGPGGGFQQKYFAPSVGLVHVAKVNDPEQEVLDLTAIVHLDPGALAQARAAALKLDRHGYDVSKVYSETPPAK